VAEPPAEHPRTDHAIAVAKKPPPRPKIVQRPVPRPVPAHPIKRPVLVASAGTSSALAAPSAPAAQSAPEPPTPPIETDVGSDAPAPSPAPAAPAPAAPDTGAAPVVVTPVVTAPVKPAPVKPAAPPSPGSLDATPSVATLEVKGSLSPAIVRRSVERTLSSLRGCYRTAAREAHATPAIDLRITFEIDENSLATQVSTGGASFGSLGICAAGVAGQIRTPEAPDVGTVQVTAVIRFRPS
jgi:hypothetical protein